MGAIELNTSAGLVSAEIDVSDFEFENGYPEGPSRTILYQVPFDQAAAFVDALVPGVISFGSGAPIIYKPAHQYPGNNNLCCLSARAVPKGVPKPDGPTTSSGKLFSSDLAIITATYKPPPWDMDGSSAENSFPGLNQPYSRVRRRTYGERELLDESSLQTTADTKKLSKKFPRESAITEINLTYYYFPTLYNQDWENIVTCLNDDTFAGYGRGQVKFMSCNGDPDTNSSDGTVTQTMELVFHVKQHDWNKQWSATPGVGYTAVDDGSGNPPYDYADFSILLPEAELSGG